jgi:hypothetical protein
MQAQTIPHSVCMSLRRWMQPERGACLLHARIGSSHGGIAGHGFRSIRFEGRRNPARKRRLTIEFELREFVQHLPNRQNPQTNDQKSLDRGEAPLGTQQITQPRADQHRPDIEPVDKVVAVRGRLERDCRRNGRCAECCSAPAQQYDQGDRDARRKLCLPATDGSNTRART